MLSKEELWYLIKNDPRHIKKILINEHDDLYQELLLLDGDTLDEKIYYFLGKHEFCVCGKIKKLNNMFKGYRKSCGEEVCIKKARTDTTIEKFGVPNAKQSKEIQEKVRKNNLEKYGVENVSQVEEFKQKRKQTHIDRYGVENAMYKEELKQKLKNTNLDKYGVENVMQNSEVKKKANETIIERYGEESPLKHESITEKKKKTNLERYGCEHVMQNKEVKGKAIASMVEKYGVEIPLQNEEIKQKLKNTNLEKYGVPFALQNEDVKQKIKKTNLEKYGVESVSHRHISQETLNKLNDLEWILEHKNANADELSESLGISSSTLNSVYRKFNVERRPSSNLENEIHSVLNSFNIEIEKNNRSIIPPLELDFYIPEYKIAIECNGSYWHSEKAGKTEDYHLNKTNRCEALGIKLIHVWEHDWDDNKEIVESMITTALGRTITISYENTIIKQISKVTSEHFLDNNCLKHGEYDIAYGLYCDDELMTVMSFKQIEGEWFITSSCDKIGYSIPKNKLFHKFLEDYSPNTVSVLVDRECDNSDVYEEIGFSFLENVEPSYSYYGFFKIWNCGEKKMLFENS